MVYGCGLLYFWSAVARGVSGTGSGFRVGWRTVGRVSICIFREFSSSVGGAFILAGAWELGYYSMQFRQFLDIS